jgi:ureidoacrylate peracid hydrolase
MDAAVLVVDMQNGFLAPAGSSPMMGFATPNADQLIHENVALLSEARSAGLPIVYTRLAYRPDLLDMPARVRAVCPTGAEWLISGSWDAAIVDELAPVAGDTIIDKNRFDAFLYTDAEMVLRTLGVRRLLVTGVVSYICVETTVRAAQQRDFEVNVASDCVGGPDAALHEASMLVMSKLFAYVSTWREALPGFIG